MVIKTILSIKIDEKSFVKVIMGISCRLYVLYASIFNSKTCFMYTNDGPYMGRFFFTAAQQVQYVTSHVL